MISIVIFWFLHRSSGLLKAHCSERPSPKRYETIVYDKSSDNKWAASSSGFNRHHRWGIINCMDETSANTHNSQTVARTTQKFRMGEQPSDFVYWQTQSYAARLAALEEIRRAYITWKYDSEPGFQRVYTIVKR